MIQLFTIPIYVWISLGFLILLSIIDIKTYKLPKGAIPSSLTMLFILIMFILVGYPNNLYLGIFAFIFALTLSDFGMFYGIADLKVLTAVGITCNGIISFLVFMVMLSIISISYKLIFKRITKKRELPFIPAILFTYAIFIIMVLITTFI